MTRFTHTGLFTCIMAAVLVGQEHGFPKEGPTQLAVEDVVALVEVGLSEDVIIEKLKQNATAFDLSIDHLLELKTVGVSSEIIKTMMNPSIGTDATAAGSGAEAKDPNWPSEIPDELGLYTKVNGRITQLEPEVVSWKARGKLMAVATRAFAGAHKNGVVRGRNSRYQVSMPLELFIVVPEGTSANEYQCVSMRQKEKQREFRIITAGIVKAGTADKNFVFFNAEKVASRLYRIQLTQLAPGEYGFVPPGAALHSSPGSVGKIYGFGVE